MFTIDNADNLRDYLEKHGNTFIGLTVDRLADDEIAKPKTSGNLGRVRKVSVIAGSALSVKSYAEKVKAKIERKASEYEKVGQSEDAKTLRESASNFKAEPPRGKTAHPTNDLVVISDKTQKENLRVYVTGLNTSKVQYYLDGKPVTGKELLDMGIVTPSSQAPSEGSKKQGDALLEQDEQIVPLTVGFENIAELNVGGFKFSK